MVVSFTRLHPEHRLSRLDLVDWLGWVCAVDWISLFGAVDRVIRKCGVGLVLAGRSVVDVLPFPPRGLDGRRSTRCALIEQEIPPFGGRVRLDAHSGLRPVSPQPIASAGMGLHDAVARAMLPVLGLPGVADLAGVPSGWPAAFIDPAVGPTPRPLVPYLRRLARSQPVVFHGSQRRGLVELRDERRSRDTPAYGDQTAVFASQDPVWALFFAVPRKRLHPAFDLDGRMGAPARLGYPSRATPRQRPARIRRRQRAIAVCAHVEAGAICTYESISVGCADASSGRALSRHIDCRSRTNAGPFPCMSNSPWTSATRGCRPSEDRPVSPAGTFRP